jgi:predicted DsbA family dithiol-disulfide isomerase
MTLEQLFRGRSFDLEAAQARLTVLMAEQGLPYGERTHTYNSRLAQELAKWAELQPGGGAIHDALFRAYFVDGDWRRASEFGITGVPTFVIKSRGVVGAQPYDALEQLVTQSGAPRRSQNEPQQTLTEIQS